MAGDRFTLRAFAYPGLAILLVISLYAMRPDRKAGPPDGTGGLTVDDEESVPSAPGAFRFLREAPIRVPTIVAGGVEPNDVDRWFERALVQPTDLRSKTLDRLAAIKDPNEIERFISRVQEEWKRDPKTAYVFLPVLAQLRHPAARELVLEAATHSSNMVRGEAARALGIVDDAESVARLEKMLDDPYEGVRTTAVRELITMRAPEAQDALERYAAQDPEERIRHVLYRLGEDTENPSAVPVLQRYFGAPGETGLLALRMLAKFGDPAAIDTLYRMIANGTLAEKHHAMILLIDAPRELLDPTRFEDQLESENGEVRRVAAELFLRMAQSGTTPDPDRAARLLEKRLTDLDGRVRQTAIAALFELGRKDVAEPYEKAILTATGDGLHEALEVTTVLCKDEKALPLVLDRLAADPPPSTSDRARLITALGEINDPKSLEAYLAVVRAAAPDEPRDGNGMPLSERAALHVSTLGPSIQPGLLAIARDPAASLFARLRALDCLRGIVGLDCAQELVDLAVDPSLPREVRMAAIESLPFVDAAEIFGPLSRALDRFVDRELQLRALYVLHDYA